MAGARRCYVVGSWRQRRAIDNLDEPGRYVVVADTELIPARPPQSPEPGIGEVLEILMDPEVNVLCLSELGIWAVGGLPRAGMVGFDPELLLCATKTEMRQFLDRAGVPVPPAVTVDLGAPMPAPQPPPFVIKPDFGFASQLVRRVPDELVWRDFLAVAADPHRWPARERFAQSIFGDRPRLLDRFLIEPDLSSLRFLSIPFIYDGTCARAFVVEGAAPESSAITDFAWRRFTAPTTLHADQIAPIEQDLLCIARTARCRPGVYHAEVLWGEEGHYFLEFSPRPTGGIVPDLVHHAYGVDIDDEAIGLFRGFGPRAPRPVRGSYVGIRATDDVGSPSDLRGVRVSVTKRDSAGSPMRDEIWRVDARTR